MYYIGIDLGGTNIAAEEKKVVMAQLFNDAGIIVRQCLRYKLSMSDLKNLFAAYIIYLLE